MGAPKLKVEEEKVRKERADLSPLSHGGRPSRHPGTGQGVSWEDKGDREREREREGGHTEDISGRKACSICL